MALTAKNLTDKAGEGTRTLDLLHGKQTLYQLSYTRTGLASFSLAGLIISPNRGTSSESPTEFGSIGQILLFWYSEGIDRSDRSLVLERVFEIRFNWGTGEPSRVSGRASLHPAADAARLAFWPE